jgi:hypothetical protein
MYTTPVLRVHVADAKQQPEDEKQRKNKALAFRGEKQGRERQSASKKARRLSRFLGASSPSRHFA